MFSLIPFFLLNFKNYKPRFVTFLKIYYTKTSCLEFVDSINSVKTRHITKKINRRQNSYWILKKMQSAVVWHVKKCTKIIATQTDASIPVMCVYPSSNEYRLPVYSLGAMRWWRCVTQLRLHGTISFGNFCFNSQKRQSLNPFPVKEGRKTFVDIGMNPLFLKTKKCVSLFTRWLADSK